MTAAGVALVVVLVAVLAFASLAARRRVLQRRGGTVELSLRLKRGARDRGWVQGIGRFVEDDLQWYRVFSLATGPRRTLSRRDLTVQRQRPPTGQEAYSLQAGAVVMECSSSRGPVELGMDASAVTGFLAWLEGRAPGATLPPG